MSQITLSDATQELQKGNRREARRLLGDIVRREPDNVAAWWYLASAMDDNQQKAQCLENLLRLYPDHKEASRLLNKLRRTVVQPTPAEGHARPILDTLDAGNQHIFAEPAPPPKEISRQVPNTHPFFETVPAILRWTLIVGTLTIALVIAALVAAGMLVAATSPDDPPVPHHIMIAVESCTATGDATAQLHFVNKSPVTLAILRGPSPDELKLGEISSNEILNVPVDPEKQIRFFVEPSDANYTGSGATIAVPAGNICTVIVE
jgi:hypothetical protein